MQTVSNAQLKAMFSNVSLPMVGTKDWENLISRIQGIWIKQKGRPLNRKEYRVLCQASHVKHADGFKTGKSKSGYSGNMDWDKFRRKFRDKIAKDLPRTETGRMKKGRGVRIHEMRARFTYMADRPDMSQWDDSKRDTAFQSSMMSAKTTKKKKRTRKS